MIKQSRMIELQIINILWALDLLSITLFILDCSFTWEEEQLNIKKWNAFEWKWNEMKWIEMKGHAMRCNERNQRYCIELIATGLPLPSICNHFHVVCSTFHFLHSSSVHFLSCLFISFHFMPNAFVFFSLHVFFRSDD